MTTPRQLEEEAEILEAAGLRVEAEEKREQAERLRAIALEVVAELEAEGGAA